LTKQVQGEVGWVYGVRNPNVHPKKLITHVHIHPVLGETTWERATYTVESAERAVDVMLTVLDVMTTETNTTLPALVECALISMDRREVARHALGFHSRQTYDALASNSAGSELPSAVRFLVRFGCRLLAPRVIPAKLETAERSQSVCPCHPLSTGL
jgi:hypothetical protein